MPFFEKIRTEYLRKKTSLSQIAYLYLANSLTSIGGFIIVMILANTLSKSDYGIYKYIFSVIGILSVFSLTGGFRNTVVQSAAKGYDGVVSHLFKLNVPLSIPMAIAGIATGGYYLFSGNIILGFGIPIATICTILSNNGIIALGYLNGRQSYGLLCVFQTIQSILTILTLFTVTSITGDLFVILLTVVLSSAFIFNLFLLYIKLHLIRNQKKDPRVLHYGKHLNILGAITTIMINIDSIIIFKIIGAQGLALYALATPFVDRLSGFLKATYFFALPKFTEQDPIKVYTQLYSRSSIMFFLGLFIFGAYFLIAPSLFKFFFPQYLESIHLSQLFALNIPIIALSILPDAFLDSIMEVRNKYIVKGIVTSTRIILIVFLIIPYGIAGVIWSEIIARVVGLTTTLLLIKRHIQRL